MQWREANRRCQRQTNQNMASCQTPPPPLLPGMYATNPVESRPDLGPGQGRREGIRGFIVHRRINQSKRPENGHKRSPTNVHTEGRPQRTQAEAPRQLPRKNLDMLPCWRTMAGIVYGGDIQSRQRPFEDPLCQKIFSGRQ